jgi:hypothetical protein
MTEEAHNVVPLFDVDQLVDAQPVGGVGRVERALRKALTRAAEAGIVTELDSGLIGGALAGAQALDVAARGGKSGGPYATAALLTPYRETLHALRLPQALVPSEGGPPAGNGQSDDASFLGDLYGTPTD